MAAERRIIQSEDVDRNDDDVRAIEEPHAAVELRRAGKLIAIVTPPDEDDAANEDDPPKGSAAALLKFAGAFKDVFTDEVMEELAAQRRIPSRTFDWE